MMALKIGTPVVVNTTGRSGAIFKIFKNWLGLGGHCYLVQWDGKRKVTPHMHDKFRRDQLTLG